MMIIFGEKRAFIKYYTDTSVPCSSCKSFELNFAVFENYFHFFYIPFFPIDEKEVEVLCLKCGNSDNRNSRVQHYKETVRTPIYLYTGLVLVAGSVVAIILNGVF
jgi:hypothetical protein